MLMHLEDVDKNAQDPGCPSTAGCWVLSWVEAAQPHPPQTWGAPLSSLVQTHPTRCHEQNKWVGISKGRGVAIRQKGPLQNRLPALALSSVLWSLFSLAQTSGPACPQRSVAPHVGLELTRPHVSGRASHKWAKVCRFHLT